MLPNNFGLPASIITADVEMPKQLFSKIRIYEFKDLIQNAKHPRRLEIVLGPRNRRRDVQCVVLRDVQSRTGPSKRSSQEDNILHSSLEKMLRDPKHRAAFHAFLCSEFSDENLDFWLACEDFRQTSSPGARSWKAEQIYQEFLHPSAPREVNVDHLTRERIQGSLAEQRAPAWCFDEAQRNIYLLMASDSWPRFLRSAARLSLRHKTSSVWYI